MLSLRSRRVALRGARLAWPGVSVRFYGRKRIAAGCLDVAFLLLDRDAEDPLTFGFRF
jgi:hypothetical protein